MHSVAMQSFLPMAAIHSFLCFESVGKRNSFIPVDFLYLEIHPNAQQLHGIIEIRRNLIQINAYLPYKMARHVTFTVFTPTHAKGLLGHTNLIISSSSRPLRPR